MLPAVQLAIEYTTQIWHEGEHYIAHAMPLDVASSGTTPEEARLALDQAVHLFLGTAAQHGTLEEVLEDAGYQQSDHAWHSPSWLTVERGETVVTV